MKNPLKEPKADWNRQKKELTNLKIGKWILLSLRNTKIEEK